MLRGGEGAGRGPRLDRMGGLVLAVVAGVLVPAAAVMLLAARDPVPRSCDSGQATATAVDGAILYSHGADLWYSEGLPGKPRKLIDFAPPRARPRTGATPSARATPSPSPSPTPSNSASPSPSASPLPPEPRVLAADISADRKQVAFLVLDPPDRPGSVSLRLMSPLDPPGTPTSEAWYTGSPERHDPAPARVQILANGRVLALAPLLRSSMPTPSPAPSAAPSTVPSAAPGTSPSASATPLTAQPRVVAVLVAPGPRPAIVGIAPMAGFLAGVYRAWAVPADYRPAPEAPALEDRVDGSKSVTAGLVQHSLVSPLVARHVPVVALGRLGHPDIALLCSVAPSARPAALSPDESLLALTDNGRTSLIDLSGLHAATPLVDGVLLSWRS